MTEESATGEGGTKGIGLGPLKETIQSVISVLKQNSRIDEWEPLFRAAVTPLLLQENGDSLVIGLLPAYVNRRPAEPELVKEVVKLKTLDEAFDLLRSLVDPIDKYAMIKSLCRADWIPGTSIDNFYYQLRQRAIYAEANLDLISSILIAQLLMRIQRQAKDEFSGQKGDESVISESGGRKVAMKIKSIVGERGAALDVGCKEIDNLVSILSNIKMDTGHTGQNRISKLSHYKKSYQGYQNRKGNNNRSRKSQLLLSYICEKPGHSAEIAILPKIWSTTVLVHIMLLIDNWAIEIKASQKKLQS